MLLGLSKCRRRTRQVGPWSGKLASRQEFLRWHQRGERRNGSRGPLVLGLLCKLDIPCRQRTPATLAASICRSCRRPLQTFHCHPDLRTRRGSLFQRRNTQRVRQLELQREKSPPWRNVLDGPVPWDTRHPGPPEDKRHCLKFEGSTSESQR